MNPIVERLPLIRDVKDLISSYLSYAVWRGKMRRLVKEYHKTWILETFGIYRTDIGPCNYVNYRSIHIIGLKHEMRNECPIYSFIDGSRRGFLPRGYMTRKEIDPEEARHRSIVEENYDGNNLLGSRVIEMD